VGPVLIAKGNHEVDYSAPEIVRSNKHVDRIVK